MFMLRRLLNTTVRCSSSRDLVNRSGSASSTATEATHSVMRTEFERASTPSTVAFNGWKSRARSLTLDQRVIVELEAPATNASGKRGDPHVALFERLDRFGVPYKTHRKFDSDVFTGVSLTLSSGADVAVLKGLEGVKSVLPVRPMFRRTVNPRGRKGAEDESSTQSAFEKDAEQHA